jgi:hypothetical protein
VSLPLRLAAAAVATAPPDPSDVDPGSWRDDAVRHELAQARRLPADDPEGADRVIELARHYDALLAMAPVSGPDGPRWVPVADPRRRRLGAFATPPGLAEALVDRAWPVGTGRRGSRPGPFPGGRRPGLRHGGAADRRSGPAGG